MKRMNRPEILPRDGRKRVQFTFDERSYTSLADLRASGMKFTEVVITNPKTGETRTLFIPDLTGSTGRNE